MGFRGPAAPNQNYYPPQQNQQVRPNQGVSGVNSLRPTARPDYRPSAVPGQFQPAPVGSVTRPPQAAATSASGPVSSAFNLNSLYAGNTGGYSSGFGGGSLAAPSPGLQPDSQVGPKALVVSGNGGDMFSSFQQKPETALSNSSISSAIVPAGTQPAPKPNALDSLQNTFSMLPAGNQPQQPRPAASSQPPAVSSQGPSSRLPHGSAVGSAHSTPAGNNQPPWPKMKPSDVQKYTKVFVSVDTDKDGKITGEQAKNLFLSWRLPRGKDLRSLIPLYMKNIINLTCSFFSLPEVLKHVWELSDQDNDTMLSLREFCISLYLMERYREGRPLPTSLPSSIMFDETLLSISGAPSQGYASAGWGPGQGIAHISCILVIFSLS